MIPWSVAKENMMRRVEQYYVNRKIRQNKDGIWEREKSCVAAQILSIINKCSRGKQYGMEVKGKQISV